MSKKKKSIILSATLAATMIAISLTPAHAEIFGVGSAAVSFETAHGEVQEASLYKRKRHGLHRHHHSYRRHHHHRHHSGRHHHRHHYGRHHHRHHGHHGHNPFRHIGKHGIFGRF